MTLDRALLTGGLLVILGWGLAVISSVLVDPQISGETAFGIILAGFLVPGLISLAVIGLLWPMARGMPRDAQLRARAGGA